MSADDPADELKPIGHEEFKPIGTIFIIAMFIVALVLLWGSVYVILLSRGVTT